MSAMKQALWSAICVASMMAAPAPAQPGPPAASPQGAASAPRPAPGPGARSMNHDRMHGRWGSAYTPGWSMMTPQEREEHHQRMQQAHTPEECRAVRDAHRSQMQERAKERGMGRLRGPRHDACGAWGRG